MKKIAFFLCSIQSSRTNQLIHPSTVPSYQIIDDLCEHAGKQRKVQIQDRNVLNVIPSGDARRKDKTAVVPSFLTKDEIKTVLQLCVERMDDILLEAIGDEFENDAYIDRP